MAYKIVQGMCKIFFVEKCISYGGSVYILLYSLHYTLIEDSCKTEATDFVSDALKDLRFKVKLNSVVENLSILSSKWVSIAPRPLWSDYFISYNLNLWSITRLITASTPFTAFHVTKLIIFSMARGALIVRYDQLELVLFHFGGCVPLSDVVRFIMCMTYLYCTCLGLSSIWSRVIV